MSLEISPYDNAEILDSEEAIKAYIEAAFEEGDAALIARCLGTVARARKVTDLDVRTGISLEQLQEDLSGLGNPDFATIMAVMKALGVSIVPSMRRERQQRDLPPAA